MKKAAFKRIGAFILTLVLVVGLLPVTALAASETITIKLNGIEPNQQVNVTVENGAPVTLNTTSVSGADSAVQLTIDDPEGKFVKVASTDGTLVGAAKITYRWWNYTCNVELIDAAAGLPINFFILQPNNEPSSTGNYSNYLPFGIAQGSGTTTAAAFLDPAVHNEIRNAPLENTITDYIATWPAGKTAEEFKEFGTQTFTFRNAYGGNAGSDSFSSEEYTIRGISICLRGGDYGNCAQCSNEDQVHAHVDGVLTKKVSPATMYIKKTIPQAQSETENFVFTLERLLQDTNMGPTYEKDPSFTSINMTATIPAGANEANVVLPAGSHETIGFGYYRILETSSAKWKSDPVYVQVASDGTLRYDSDLEGEFTTIATEGSPVIIENTIQEYTITYDLNGGEPGNANEDLSYANRKYGTATPTITAPTRTGYTFGGWTPAFSSTVVGNANYVATWTGKAGTAYKVEYYKQDLYNPGKYDLVNADTENETGTTDATVNLEGNTEIENKYDSLGYVINKTHPGSKLTGTIAADGSLVLRVYYDLKTYTVRWVDVNGDELGKDTGVRHGTMPTYDGAEPAGPDTAAINYIFK